MLKISIIAAIAGHILCGLSDCLLGYSKKGRLDLKQINNAEKMSEMFADMPLSYPLCSALLGVFAITLFSFGYFGLSGWMSEYSAIASTIMFIAAAVYAVPIAAHHVLFAVIEWLYIRLGRTNEAREAVLELQKKTIAPMFVGYLGLLVFTVTLFVMIISGKTALPQWTCIFNTIVAMILLLPTKLPAKGNIAGAVMFFGLLFVI